MNVTVMHALVSAVAVFIVVSAPLSLFWPPSGHALGRFQVGGAPCQRWGVALEQPSPGGLLRAAWAAPPHAPLQVRWAGACPGGGGAWRLASAPSDSRPASVGG